MGENQHQFYRVGQSERYGTVCMEIDLLLRDEFACRSILDPKHVKLFVDCYLNPRIA